MSQTFMLWLFILISPEGPTQLQKYGPFVSYEDCEKIHTALEILVKKDLVGLCLVNAG